MPGWNKIPQHLQLRWLRSVPFQRWQALSPRDQRLLALLCGFVLMTSLYTLIWQPAKRAAETAQMVFEQQREFHIYIKSQVPVLQGYSVELRRSIDPASLQALITASATTQGLTIQELSLEGKHVRISMQPMPFSQLLQWLTMIEKENLYILEAGLSRRDAGQIVANLVIGG